MKKKNQWSLIQSNTFTIYHFRDQVVISFLKKKNKVKKKTRIRIEQIIADGKKDRITLNLTKISETNLDKTTSKRRITRAEQYAQLNDSTESSHPLYTSILNSQKLSSTSNYALINFYRS